MGKKYEILYIIPGKYTDEEIGAITEKVKGILTEAGASVAETHHLGKRKLAYPIKHVRHGNYVLSYFEAETDIISKINATLRLTGEVLRHLIVERDPRITELPSFAEAEWPVERERVRRPRPELKPQEAPGKKEAVSIEELDKKLEEILTEEVK